jgi:hypothetical protein
MKAEDGVGAKNSLYFFGAVWGECRGPVLPAEEGFLLRDNCCLHADQLKAGPITELLAKSNLYTQCTRSYISEGKGDGWWWLEGKKVNCQCDATVTMQQSHITIILIIFIYMNVK